MKDLKGLSEVVLFDAINGRKQKELWGLLADNYVIAPRGQGHETKMAGGNLKEAMDALTPGADPTYPT